MINLSIFILEITPNQVVHELLSNNIKLINKFGLFYNYLSYHRWMIYATVFVISRAIKRNTIFLLQ